MFASKTAASVLRTSAPLKRGTAGPAKPLSLATQMRFFNQTPLSFGSAPATSSSAASAASAAAGGKPATVLDWNSFFKLRKTRRRWQLLFSGVGFLAAGSSGAVALANGLGGELMAQVPLDPMITMGLVTSSAASLGWLMGPSVGSRVFYWLNRQVTPQFMLKENNFFARIKRHRVDPSSSSAGNPVPDFYGEKISSVTGYRHWLKDQRAFNKKRTSFV
ncbi:hypothetical protein TD95_002813 [Thielaviopsis punctulata]|uniref:Presequence translocated-associated motor subunit PAM17 n=1 Tax=Thielaviopsis punctulata TaxID=72032 RepID=A0A0F4ZGN3_9PEZI|nr:hypothetical protein TD95_002813 [Thielaviopsis punctulata]